MLNFLLIQLFCMLYRKEWYVKTPIKICPWALMIAIKVFVANCQFVNFLNLENVYNLFYQLIAGKSGKQGKLGNMDNSTNWDYSFEQRLVTLILGSRMSVSTIPISLMLSACCCFQYRRGHRHDLCQRP